MAKLASILRAASQGLGLAALLLSSSTLLAAGGPIYLSVGGTGEENAQLGGLNFSDGDVVRYYDGSASLILSESEFRDGEANVDALHVINHNEIVISTARSESLYGTSFDDGDLVRVDLYNDTASIVFDSSLFAANEDIDAVGYTAGGKVLLSTRNEASLGGLDFIKGDVVSWDGQTAELVFDHQNFKRNNENIDAVDQLDNGDLLLSTSGRATIDGQDFFNGDVFRWDGWAAYGYFSSGEFSYLPEGAGIDGFSTVAVVPEPSTYAALGAMLVAAMLIARRRQREAKA